MEFVKDVKEYYKGLDAMSDPRTRKWPFVSSIASPLFACLLYLFIVNVGPHLMEKRQPFEIRKLMVIYNLGATLLNLYCTTHLFVGSWKAGYKYICQRVIVSTEPTHLMIAEVIWWFYISKYLEMLDTVFFIMRKKTNQISFLHVYHHTSVVIIWWIGIKWVPGGSSFYCAAVNSFVHVVMYTYYGLSMFPSLHRYLWWKRYLTQFQLLQFGSLFIQAILALRQDCGFPRWMCYALLGYMTSMIFLFGNFYLQTYLKGMKKHDKDVNGNVHSVNGKLEGKPKKDQ
ncbi:elongation of very long chain fatty acids protein 4-like [Xenia sp. Carnegie-2017]|uniref:elongation of very long chain fatty acids protein 4-like n=1 Tax=Xenia sp. Carnegie-2017 TaxID=2897299 RepID=UPI001F04B99C|nr:elongation of very long chain fatty acids protein 4-like [Xenia sp. Carnegie-2017]XP_046861373.1 elongation of very long chain fatty acids protein 4-like [Xenia sp. Carnegie-2017]XP_046861374.1 elongation of very long chain fatty acids protein 4-like [Xenia sp. Carnegie-2017]XP_046861375.1 elongation of very long chain fatty acids protein 4-like [Xenia sp. Carnegie-2017]